MQSRVIAEPAFTGREKELKELTFQLDTAVEGKGKTVFVSGEAGSGKSRLTREFLTLAQREGVAILAGWCLSDANAPYFPFAKAFASYFSGCEEEVSISQKLDPFGSMTGTRTKGIGDFGITSYLTGVRSSDKSGKPGMLSPYVWKDQLFLAVGKTLESISAQKPLILFIEDIHWADSASLALLHFIAQVIGSEKILVLATFRSEELTADAEGHPHPLVETLRIMKREDLFSEIKLSNLDSAEVKSIAENMVGGSLQSEFAEKLAKESRGNPLFIVESIRMLHERKNLVENDNKWCLGADELGIPSKVKDIILRRLTILKYSQRRVLDAASVIGEKFDLELLSGVLGLDSLAVLETLDVIAHSTSLISFDENYYRFDHSRSREALYEELSPPLKKGYHAKVAERLESAGKKDQLPLSEIAYHYAEAGIKGKAIRYALAAGQDSLIRWGNSEAIKQFTYVLQTIDDAPENFEAKSLALDGLGDAYCANGMYTKGAETFEKLAACATGSLKLRAYIKQMEAVWYKDMNPALLIESVKKVEKLTEADRLESARLRWNSARAHFFLGDFKKGLEEHEEALRIFKEEYSLPDVAHLIAGTGSNRGTLPIKLDSLRTEFEKATGEKFLGTAMTHELGDARMEVTNINIFVAGTFYSIGLFQEALNSYQKALEISERIGDFRNRAFALNKMGEVLWLLSGNWAEGIPQLLKALEYSLKTDSQLTQSEIYANLALRYAILGDLKQAEEYYGELSKMPKETVSNLMIGLETFTAENVMLAVKGKWKQANQQFKNEIEFIRGSLPQCFGWEIAARKIYAWALDKQGQTVEAQAQLSEVQRLHREAEKRLAHADLYANLMARRKVVAGEESEIRLDIINIARKPGVIARIEDIIPPEFKVTSVPPFCNVQNSNIEMKEKAINPFQVVTINLKYRATKPGNYNLNPNVSYIDDLGGTQKYKPEPAIIEVSSAQPAFEILPGRVATGHSELDRLLLGGIPENHSIMLTSPANEERELLSTRFIQAGAEAGEATIYVTVETATAKTLAEDYPANFHLIICNPQADSMIQNLPNIQKLKGVENLTDIDIALTKAFRALGLAAATHRRICIDILSDVLLQHHAVTTRRWLSSLLPTLKSKGFTVLATLNPKMHSPEEVESVLSLFEGEINMTERETGKGTEKVLKIQKLSNQKYLETALTLKKQDLNT